MTPFPMADLTPERLSAVMTDMGYRPGWFTAAELFNWYASMARDDGLEPVSKKRFGLSLAAMGYRSAIRRSGVTTVRAWFISARAWRA